MFANQKKVEARNEKKEKEKPDKEVPRFGFNF
jgi:hypothetical protein